MNKPPRPLWFMETQLGRPSPQDCLFHVIPVMPALPGRRDARLTPQAVLETSQHLAIGEQQALLQQQGIFTQAPLDSLGDRGKMLYEISAAVARTVQLRKIPVLIGNDPMITLGALHALLEQKQPVGLVQISPRARLKDDDDGNPLGSECLARRALDMGHALFQIGVLSISPEDNRYRKNQNTSHLDAADIISDGWPNPVLPPDFPKAIYIALDLEVLTPASLPATGRPVSSGLSADKLRDGLGNVISSRQVLGFDVVGMPTGTEPHETGTTAAGFVVQTMGIIIQNLTMVGAIAR